MRERIEDWRTNHPLPWEEHPIIEALQDAKKQELDTAIVLYVVHELESIRETQALIIQGQKKHILELADKIKQLEAK